MAFKIYDDQVNRFRMPIPGVGSPYNSGQAARIYGEGGMAPPPWAQPKTGPARMPGQLPTPGPVSGGTVPPRMPPVAVPGQRPQDSTHPFLGEREPVEPTPTFTVSPYMETMYQSIKDIDPEQRAEYLQTTLATIKERLDRYEFRTARGIPLTAEQQRQYNSLRAAFGDIQKYLNDPKPYDDFFANEYARVSGRAGSQRLPTALSSAGTRYG